MKGEYRNISMYEDAAADNCIFSIFTRTWGCKVRTMYGLDKLRFCFIEVGTSGKGKSFEIRMDCLKFGGACFKAWANDILSVDRRFERIMASEKEQGEQYAKYYKFTTGPNAEKTIGIANSSKNPGSYVISAKGVSKTGETVNTSIPVSISDLMIFAQEFIRTYSERQADLDEIRREAAVKQNQWFYEHEQTSENEDSPSNQPSSEVPTTEEELPFEEQKQPGQNQAPDTGKTGEYIPAQVVITGYRKENGLFIFTTNEGDLSLTADLMSKDVENWTVVANALQDKGECPCLLLTEGNKIVQLYEVQSA